MIIGFLFRSAYILADRGYDVWLGNARGSTYSRGHVSLNADEDPFWDFSLVYHSFTLLFDNFSWLGVRRPKGHSTQKLSKSAAQKNSIWLKFCIRVEGYMTR